MFEIDYLDHVALRVKDIEVSANWYERILGLQRYQLNDTDPFPLFMLKGNTGLALFPTETKRPGRLMTGDWLVVHHISFRVTKENFQQAQFHLKQNKVRFDIQDNQIFQSLLFRDPDGHRIKLITHINIIPTS